MLVENGLLLKSDWKCSFHKGFWFHKIFIKKVHKIFIKKVHKIFIKKVHKIFIKKVHKIFMKIAFEMLELYNIYFIFILYLYL